MKFLPVLVLVCQLIIPSVVFAQQISPSPNPLGAKITVDTHGSTNLDVFITEAWWELSTAAR